MAAFNQDLGAIAAEEAPPTAHKEDPMATPREAPQSLVAPKDRRPDSFVDLPVGGGPEEPEPEVQEGQTAETDHFGPEHPEETGDEPRGKAGRGRVHPGNFGFSFPPAKTRRKRTKRWCCTSRCCAQSWPFVLSVHQRRAVFGKVGRGAPVRRHKVAAAKVRLEKHEGDLFPKEIQRYFRTLAETVVRQRHVFALPIESEVKCYLLNQPNNEADLERFTAAFGKPFAGDEKLFAPRFSKASARSKRARTARAPCGWRPARTTPSSRRKSGLRHRIRDHPDQRRPAQGPKADAHRRTALRLQPPAGLRNAVFEILPRYPIFYSLGIPSTSPLLWCTLWSGSWRCTRATSSSWPPFFFDLPYLTKDSEGNVVSITKSIRGELTARFSQTLQAKIQELERCLTSLAVQGLPKAEAQTLTAQMHEALYGIDSVLVFFLGALQSENFNRELEQRGIFPEIVQSLERVFLEASQNPNIDLRHFVSALIFPDVLRRRQVIKILNPEEFGNVSPKDNVVIQLHVPTTFTFLLLKWAQSKSKNPVKNYLLVPQTGYVRRVDPTRPDPKAFGANEDLWSKLALWALLYQRLSYDEFGIRGALFNGQFRLNRAQEFVVEEEEEGEEEEEEEEVDMSSQSSSSQQSRARGRAEDGDGVPRDIDRPSLYLLSTSLL